MSLAERAKGWFLEPESTVLTFGCSATTEQERVEDSRPVIAVVGLAAGCGATTLARALAATLARRDPCGAAVVTGSLAVAGFSAPGRSAARLAARLGTESVATKTAGRLCLAATDDPAALARATARLAPVVLDLPRDRPPAAAVTVALLSILVAPADVEPALAELAAGSLDPPPLIVVTGAARDSAWRERGALLLPWSRIGAGLATAGFEPRGPFGAAVTRIADGCEASECA